MSARPLTIWMFNHYAVPASEPGGSRHYALAKHLIQRGHTAVIIAACRNYQAPQISRLGANESSRLETLGGVAFLWLKTSGYRKNGASRIWNMLSYSRRVIAREGFDGLPRPDVVIGSSPHPFAALAAQRIAADYSVPFLLEVRDLWPQSLIDVAGVSRFNPFVVLLAIIERFLYRRAQTVVSLLPAAADHIRTVARKSVEVVWVPNGVDLSMVPAPRPASDTAPFTLMYAGAHGPANGLDVILDAAAILEREGAANGLKVLLIGEGSEKYRLQTRAADLGLTSVGFENPIPKNEIYTHLAKADGFLMLLKDSPVFRWGISPNKLFDYMATGRPVIFGVNTPYNPVAMSGGGLTTPPENARALADAIVRLKALPRTERAAMGERARAYVVQNHSFDQLAGRIETASLDAIKGMALRESPTSRNLHKRVLDNCLATLLLLVFLPLLLVIASAILVTMKSPVFFRQTRAGLGGKPFTILKFRTMRHSVAAKWDPSADGERITPLGRFLRRWSLDELPQLFNVLNGEMSLVGPRPLPVEYVQRYTTDQAHRLAARPGVTGWAQVNGRNELDWDDRFRLDTWYVDNQSLKLDLQILLKTVSQVLARRGISGGGVATMKEFVGPGQKDAAERMRAGDFVA